MTAVKLYRNKRDGWWVLSQIVHAGKPFRNSTGSFRGEAADGRGSGCLHTITTGQLREDHARQLRRDMDTESAGVDYVIYSYATPIAWHTRGHGWTVPDARYSVTTSGHQGIARTAIANVR